MAGPSNQLHFKGFDPSLTMDAFNEMFEKFPQYTKEFDIKLKIVRQKFITLNYKDKNGENFQLNLIDTPGHVDFAYEVSRSLSACEGSILVVDSTQGVEAQTLANVYQAIDLDHEIIPVINKIDLPAAEPETVAMQIEDVIGLDASDAIYVSAKTGQGIPVI